MQQGRSDQTAGRLKHEPLSRLAIAGQLSQRAVARLTLTALSRPASGAPAGQHLEVGVDHQARELLEGGVVPAELLARLRGVADELLDLGRAQELGVEADVGPRGRGPRGRRRWRRARGPSGSCRSRSRSPRARPAGASATSRMPEPPPPPKRPPMPKFRVALGPRLAQETARRPNQWGVDGLVAEMRPLGSAVVAVQRWAQSWSRPAARQVLLDVTRFRSRLHRTIKL